LFYSQTMSAASRRVFFAFWPDAQLREALSVLAREVARESQGRPTAPEKLHLTLSFLGEQATERIASLLAMARGLRSEAFDLALDEIGGFPRTGIAWLGASAPPAALSAVHAALESALRDGGFPVEDRSYAPHLTLARRTRRAIHRRLPAPLAWRISSFCLMASELGARGPEYQTIGEWALRAS
jgi:RNA 2',3'-cyclic 3'-phosphodiesterase